MNKINWQLALNLKSMLTKGKIELKITNKSSCNEEFSDRIKNIVTDYLQHLNLSQIYNCIQNMSFTYSTDYNKITAELLKQFNNESVSVVITIPEKTILKFHVNYIPEAKGSDGTIILVVCGIILLAISAYLYFS